VWKQCSSKDTSQLRKKRKKKKKKEQNRNHCPAVTKKRKEHRPAYTQTEGNHPHYLDLLPTILLKLPPGDPQLLFHHPDASPSSSSSRTIPPCRFFSSPPDAKSSPEL
jgi:hypothetical protein